MKSHVSSALFLHTPETEELVERVKNNPFATTVIPVELGAFIQVRSTGKGGMDTTEQFLLFPCDRAELITC